MGTLMTPTSDRVIAWEVFENSLCERGSRRLICLADFDAEPCPYCGQAMMARTAGVPQSEVTAPAVWPDEPTRDHMTPLCRGGLDIPSNLIVVCRLCNELKGDLTLPELHDNMVADGDPCATLVALVLATRPYASLAPFHDSSLDFTVRRSSDAPGAQVA